VIVADTSALVAILRREPEADAFSQRLAAAGRTYMSALSVFETKVVLGGGRPTRTVRSFEAWLEADAVDVVPFDAAMADAAFAAYSRYGKGVHPHARLSFCDCAAYALARALDAPLLFKGADFRHTDVTPAV